jgi:Icc-related predicted phosphoesterase
MRRAAIITDIHANLPALQAALRRIDELDVDGVYCGGDLVGYGPHPNEVCALIVDRARSRGLRLRLHHTVRP